MELRQRLAARQLTGRLSWARYTGGLRRWSVVVQFGQHRTQTCGLAPSFGAGQTNVAQLMLIKGGEHLPGTAVIQPSPDSQPSRQYGVHDQGKKWPSLNGRGSALPGNWVRLGL
jgi:hypothetical protein